MYYVVYHINTIALYQKEMFTLLMNENKKVDTLNTNCKVRWCT